MSRQQTSSVGRLKRDLAVFSVALIGAGILLHFALPWFDFVDLISGVVGFALEYPKAAAVPIGILLIFVAMAAVDDRFSP